MIGESMKHREKLRTFIVMVGMVLMTVACGSDWDDSAGWEDSGDWEDSGELGSVDGETLADDDELSDDADGVELSEDGLGTSADATAAAGGVDLSLERDDVDCSAEGLGSSEESDFSVSHVVVGGSLGAVCLGSEDPTLVEAWRNLAAITPPLQLADLALFGGFSASDDSDEVTLAFVNVVDFEGSAFQMSINLQAFAEDGDEALLTMAHEFSHVFTGLSTQLDRSDEAFESCDTYFNGEGCYRADSLMFAWITEFWGGGLIDQIDPYGEASGADGQERCDLNAGFFGAYGASTPEEDFAESFSAMVFRLDANSSNQQAKLDWLAAQPGLAEFRDRAVDAGFGPLGNNFDRCGEGS